MNLCQITIVGNVTRNAEIVTANEKDVVRFGVAVNRGKDQPADFFEVAAWEKPWAVDVAKKGDLILVQGPMRSSKGDNGITYWIVNADKVLLMSRKDNKDNNGKSTAKSEKNDDYPIYAP